jgi:hypothetical protein
MKVMLMAVSFVSALLLALVPLTYAAAEPQVFPTSAGPVKITPLNHASTLIEAGRRFIWIRPSR